MEYSQSVTDVDGIAVVQVTGEVEVRSAPALGARLQALVEAGAPVVVLDLGAVTFFDSNGINMLRSCEQLAENRATRLALVAAPRRVIRLLQLTGLSDRLPVYDTVAQARESIRS